MQIASSPIDENAIVSEVLQRFPATIPVFNELGIHTCCGGAVPLRVAAERDGVELSILIARLNAALERS